MTPSEKRRRKNRKVAVFALAVALSLVAGIVIAIAPWEAEKYDRVTLCPKDGDYPRAAVLVDATDSLSESQRKTVMDEINALRGRLALHEWVGIFVLNEDNLTLPAPEIALCYPGDGSTANRLIRNPDLIRRHFEKKFQRPLESAIERLAQAPSRATSPIHEMIRAVALDRNFDSTKKRRLIVISDMLQNTPPEYSHYRDGADFSAWRNSAHGKAFPEFSLLGVEVEILYLKRANDRDVQNRGHVSFWEDYFAELGASVKILKPIP